ncbi:hypothetical protein KP509_37G064700 [Ceratopteris richardii]|uniref:Uncharacterized protein n=1 Tax=Ceratopteris richardii TaxID=49495 RepID=A0A8T2Q9S3_CERRI|nr:hypothetical protein KP509_37G064700 [Ceratopteris richardii]
MASPPPSVTKATSEEPHGAAAKDRWQSLTIEIPGTPASPGDDAGRARSHISPFVPDVGRAGGMMTPTSSTMVRSASTIATPWSYTPMSSNMNDGKPWTKEDLSTDEGRDQERRAAPEKALTLFAMRLAVLEKIASQVGTLSFIWATVVLLGGFAVTLKGIDFWYVTVILIIEGARIFGRSHELEWQHQNAGTSEGAFERIYEHSSSAVLRSARNLLSTFNMRRKQETDDRLQAVENSEPQRWSYGKDLQTGQHHITRTWSISQVPIVHLLEWILNAGYISRLLYWMQLAAACVAIILALYRLQARNFTRGDEGDSAKNHASSLFIFYSLATFEALIFLLERSYWQYQISVRKILVHVNSMCGLSTQDLGTTRRFFYEVYSQCLTESVLEGLKMDMVDYALTWLHSVIPGEQLGGLRVLQIFSTKKEFADDTLRALCVKQGTLERLLEMVTWRNPAEHEIRKGAADLLCTMVKSYLYSSRVVAISGSIEGIFSLLSRCDDDDCNASVAEYTRQGAAEPMAPRHIEMHIVGLRILKNLAKDPLICTKIGLTRGVLGRLVSFIDTNRDMLHNAEEPQYRMVIVKKSLDLLNLLASASGSSGKMLRQHIARIVYTISNLHIILKYGQTHMLLQTIAADILCKLAMDDGVSLMIGRTGGVMRSLAALLVRESMTGNSKQAELAKTVGEALALLVLKNKENCLRLLNLKVRQGKVVDHEGEEENEGAEREMDQMDVVEVLMRMMSDCEVGHLAMCILRFLCAYSEDEGCRQRLAKGTMSEAVRLINSRGRAQEAAIGLLAVTVAEVKTEELVKAMENGGMTVAGLASKLDMLLKRHTGASTALPRLRRYVIELAVALAERHETVFIAPFQEINFRSRLRRVADSVCELENYATFSGVSGLTAYDVAMSQLVDMAIERFRTSSSPRLANPST